MGPRALNRLELDRRAFWKEMRAIAKAREPVRILTGCREVDKLPWDIRLLLSRAERSGRLGAVGLTPDEIHVIREVLQWILLMALVAVVVLFIVRHYRFKVKRGNDGTIEIEGEPA